MQMKHILIWSASKLLNHTRLIIQNARKYATAKISSFVDSVSSIFQQVVDELLFIVEMFIKVVVSKDLHISKRFVHSTFIHFFLIGFF